MITVFHAKPELFRDSSMYGITKRVNAKTLLDWFNDHGVNVPYATDNAPNYKRVAHVAADSLDHAYASTQHAFDAWQNNVNVNAFDNEARSTSVGDLLLKETPLANGDSHYELYAVAPFGFDKIDG